MLKEVLVPDIGEYSNVDVIEVIATSGVTLEKDNTIFTLETDKAMMEIPAPFAGVVVDVKIAAGDKVSEGDLVLTMEIDVSAEPKKAVKKTASKVDKPSQEPEGKSVVGYASPGIRRFARELGTTLENIEGTGRKGRITKENVKKHVNKALKGGNSTGMSVAPMTTVDFSKFGEIEKKPLSRIKKISGSFLHRNWVTIPHVTQFDEADITELEQFRKDQKPLAEKQGVKLTPLVFMMKACVAGLREFPNFNASLDEATSELVLKKYFHIGVAVDTPNGLVVPVVRDVDQKSLFQLAAELATISQKARDGKLTATDMQGGCFTISSLGGIGGKAFTPIINAPEVAILGVSKAKLQPVFIDDTFKPKLIVPLSLSYDHRVIDGAEGVRFTKFLAERLSDIRKLLL